MRRTLFYLALFSKSLFALAQETQATRVLDNVKLNKQGFTGLAFPFDEPFNMVGDPPDNAYRITYSYRVSGEFKKWMTFPKSNSFSDEWKKDGAKFTLFCPGMHPNVKYTFEFEIFRKPDDDPKLKELLIRRITDKLTEFANQYKDGYGNAEKTELNEDLNQIFLDQLRIECGGSEIRSKCDPDNKNFKLDIANDKILHEQFENFVTVNATIASAHDNLWSNGGYMDALQVQIQNLLPGLRDSIDRVLSGKLKFTPLTEELLKEPVIYTLPAFKSYTLLDGLRVLRKILLTTSNLEGFLSGVKKIDNKDLADSDSPDYEGFYFINAVLKTLGEGVIKELVNNDTATGFLSVNQLFESPSILDAVLVQLKRHQESRNLLLQLVKDFPDLTTSIVLADALTYEAISIPNISSEKNPYISVDGGLAYASAFQTILGYYGTNFYLTPVNKQTPLSAFKGWNKFKKMVCFTVAIGNYFGSRPVNSYSILGETQTNDLLLGLGLRWARTMKLNAFWSPYKTNNTNVLEPDKDLKLNFLLSVGADVNLIKAFGDVGRALNLLK